MWRCRMVDWLIRFLPIRFIQDILIRRHIAGCGICSERLAKREEVRSLLVREQDLGFVADFQPEAKPGLEGGSKQRPASLFPGWKWVWAAAGLTVVLLAGIWWQLGTGTRQAPETEQRFQLNFVRIGDKPARTYVYQPQNVEMTLVWVEKNAEGE